jgi:tRNA(Ile)-lysidine synthase
MASLRLRLSEQFSLLPADAHVWVAFSGGMDSHVLLHALAQVSESIPLKLHAVYINHGLSPHASDWARHCEQVCNALSVPFKSIGVTVALKSGVSPEAAAREARYQAFLGLTQSGGYLCTAHHQDDQAETVFLQLLRGAGPKGLAAMAAQAPFGAGTLLRPLLQFTRAELAEYASVYKLQWIDDESNFDTDYDRNFLRHEIIPRLRERWPSLTRTLDRSARLCAESAQLLDELAQQDLLHLQEAKSDVISISGLKTLTPERQRNVLRYWVRQHGFALPSDIKLQHVLSDVVDAGEDRQPCVQWPGAEVRRYGGYLYLMPPLVEFQSNPVIPWDDLKKSLLLPDGRRLVCSYLKKSSLGQQAVSVRFRQGGEQVQVMGMTHTTSLKKVLQDLEIPPWLRDRVPLIYVGEELVQVAGSAVRGPFVFAVKEAGFEISVEW